MKKTLTLTVALALVALGSVSWASTNLNSLKSNIYRIAFEKNVVSSTQPTAMSAEFAKVGKGGEMPAQTITICKSTIPAGGTGFPFSWANGFGPLAPFTLNDGQCETKNVTNQDHFNKFTENVPPGWTLTNISCTYTTSVVKIIGANANPAFQSGDNTVTIDLNEANVKCTFTNRQSIPKKAKICVLKFADTNGNGRQDAGEPALPGWKFEIKDANGNIVATITTGGPTQSCADVPAPGTYTVTEQVQSGWIPTTQNPQTVTVSPDQTVNLSFGNKKKEVGSCDLAITKTISPTPLVSGQPATVTVTVKNVGTGTCDPGAFPGTGLRDNQPTGLTFAQQPVAISQSGGSATWQCGNEVPSNNLTCATPNPLPPGYSATFSIKATVTAPPGSSVTNCATVSNVNDANQANNKSCVTTPVAPGGVCDREIKKTVTPNPAQSGQQVAVTLTVTNIGTAPCPVVAGINVADSQPSGLTFQLPVSANKPGWSCGFSGPGVIAYCTSTSPLLPGAANAVTITFTAQVTASAGSTIQNCAEVTNVGDANQANNKTCVTTPVAPGVCDREIRKTVTPNPAQSGQHVTVSLTVTNIGTAPCPVVAGINVADSQPSGLTFQLPVSANKPGWSCGFSGPGVIAYCTSTSPLLPGAANAVTITFAAKVTASAGSTIQNCAGLTNVGDANPANDGSCVTVKVKP